MAWLWLLPIAGALVAALLPLLYTHIATTFQDGLPRIHNKRICLLIAHPDDEAMFFAPTVLALTRPETGNHVKILCLSSGNADGLGETRKKELVKSAMTLGLRQEDDVFVLDSPDFQDSMTATWDAQKISNLLCSAFGPHLAHSAARPTTATANIDVLITFDAAGVSSHPNHISLHAGARAFIAALLRANDGRPSPVALYTLSTVSFLRKYTALLDIFPTLAAWAVAGRSTTRGPDKSGPPRSLLFLNPLTGPAGLPTAWRAMVSAHKSQMVWFRWGWITLSRYMVMNDLWLERFEGES